MNNFKYIKNIKDGEGTILIYKQIGNSIDKKGNISYGVNGPDFGNEMLYLQKVCESITVRINSVGGSVLDGYAIASSIYNSEIPVKTIIDGLAASTALWCAAAGNVGNRLCMDYGTGMIHESSGGNDKEVSAVVDGSIVKMLSNRSNRKPEDIEGMMKKETWLNASQLLKEGFVDEVINTGKKVAVKKTDSLYNMALVYNKVIIPETMSKLNTLLKLSNSAEEPEQEAAINKLNADLTAANTELATLKAEKLKNETEAAAALKTKATVMVNDAVKKGLLKQDEAETTILNASESQAKFDFVSNFVSRLGSDKTAIKVFDIKNAGDKSDAGDRSTWDYRKWENEDEQGLKNMYVNNRAQFDELVKGYKPLKK